MQYLITAYDGTDKEAYTRRMSVRPKHLENMAKVKEAGHVICAGGITGIGGKLVGSFLVMEYETKEEFDEYLKNEPYVMENVWEKIKVDTCNVVIAGPVNN